MPPIIPMTMPSPTIAELKAAIKEAEAAQEAEARYAAEHITTTHDWRVDWKSDHVFYCGRSYDAATRHAIADWRAKYPTAPAPFAWSEPDRWNGMTYLLIGNWLACTGGGTLVLNLRRADAFDHEPTEITDSERDALRAGIVPDSLKAKSW